jgi:hypothetical protein
MSTKFMVNGEEKELSLIGKNGIDWSEDFIGNTFHGMASDEEGRYVVNQEDYEWWENMIAEWQRMESVVAEYKEQFDGDEVDRVVNDTVGGYDLENQPKNVISALRDTFGAI